MPDATVRDILAIIGMTMVVAIIIAIAWIMYGWLWLCKKKEKSIDDK